MFSHHFYPQVLATRPRRSHIHAGEAIRSRLHIPLEKIHTIVSKLDKIGDWQDGMADQAGLIISAELTGLSRDDLTSMQSLRMSITGASRNPRKIMRTAQLEIQGRWWICLRRMIGPQSVRSWTGKFPAMPGPKQYRKRHKVSGNPNRGFRCRDQGDQGK